MGKYDNDRFLKELAVKLCLTRGMLPYLEVVVSNVSDLSDSSEALTDIDVLGIQSIQDGDLRRTSFDCKTSSKMSAINRAFWAAGLLSYSGCDEAYVILKSKAVSNHRISALSMNVDLHDETSFVELARSYDAAFARDARYQSSIDRWNAGHTCYIQNRWSEPLYALARNIAPLTRAPWGVFRQTVAELRATRGYFDPNKDAHVAIFLDVLTSMFVLWTAMGRDVRRFYSPSDSKEAFEAVFRYYVWGGRDSYNVRKQLRERVIKENGDAAQFDFPEWKKLISFVGIIINAPHDIFPCADVCRELSFRYAAGESEELDKHLVQSIRANKRIRQFILALSEYSVAACGLPRDLNKRIEGLLLTW